MTTVVHHLMKCAQAEGAEMNTNLACVRENQKSNPMKEKKPSKEQPQVEQHESESRNRCC